MNLTWHIVKKDLRALRWPLLFWVGLIAAKLLIGLVILTTDAAGDSQWFKLLDGLAKSLAGLECIGVLLVAALVHEDMLVGTSAFWLTRPISGTRLLAAKLLALGLIFVVLPVIVTLPWWLGCHLTPGQIAGAALETVVLHLLVVLLGLMWAVVTDGFGRFLLWVLALVTAIPLAAAVIGSYFGRHNVVLLPDVATTRFAAIAGVALLGVAAVVVHQFLTRRTWQSVSLIASTIALVVMIALWWPWSWHIDSHWNDYLNRRAENAWPMGAEPPGLAFVAKDAVFLPRPAARPDSPVQLRFKYRVDGVPANQALLSGVGNYSLRWEDGTLNQGWSWLRTGWDLQEVAARTVLGPAAPETKIPPDSQALQSIPVKAATRLEHEPAAYVLRTRFVLVEPEAPAQVPLVAGGRFFVGQMGERIGSVEKNGEELAVTFVRHRPALLADYLAEMGNFVLGAGRGVEAVPAQFLLVNRAQNFADRGTILGGQITRVAGVELSWETRSYRAMKANGSRKPRWEAIKALEDAEFDRVTFRSRGNFAHEFRIDSLLVTPTAGN